MGEHHAEWYYSVPPARTSVRQVARLRAVLLSPVGWTLGCFLRAMCRWQQASINNNTELGIERASRCPGRSPAR